MELGVQRNSKVFDLETIEASGSASKVLDVRKTAMMRNFSAEFTIAGSGTAKLEATPGRLVNNSFVASDAATVIKADLAAGTWFGTFLLPLTPYIQFKVTETGGVSSVIADCFINMN